MQEFEYNEHKASELSKMKEKLSHWMLENLEKGKEFVDTAEAGKVIDMIKDLCEAEEKVWKAMYYKLETKECLQEMEESEDRYGYNSRRYSDGRYAPAGMGKRGYRPMEYDMPKEGRWRNPPYAVMGYSEEREEPPSVYTRSYDRYKDARRHYTASKNPQTQEEMNRYANEHLTETIATFREMWSDATPDVKANMKTHLTNLVNEMTV